MFLLYESLGYIGLLLMVIGFVWLMLCLFRRRWKRALWPTIVFLIGMVAFAYPIIKTRMAVVDLGPLDREVNGERHLTLTGWDRDDYSVLQTMTDTVVLQMANPDVTDATLNYLENMSQLSVLDLNDTQVSDAGLASLAKLASLKTLKLRATKITDIGFRDHLMKLPALKQLDVRQTEVDSASIDEWKAAGEGRRALR